MKTKDFIWGLMFGLLIAVVIVAFALYIGKATSDETLGTAEFRPNATSSISTSTASTTSGLLVLARTQVNFRSFTNLGATYVSIACNPTSTGVVFGQGVTLSPSSTVEFSMENGNPCRGDMSFISNSGTPTVGIYQFP